MSGSAERFDVAHRPERVEGLTVEALPNRRRRRKVPKLKTHRGAAKRLKVTGTGKIRRRKAGKSHLLTGRGADRRRRLRRGDLIHPSSAKRIRRLIPYL